MSTRLDAIEQLHSAAIESDLDDITVVARAIAFDTCAKAVVPYLVAVARAAQRDHEYEVLRGTDASGAGVHGYRFCRCGRETCAITDALDPLLAEETT